MFHHVNRRSFLKQSATSLLTSFLPPLLLAEGEAPQGLLRANGQGASPIPAPPPINMSSSYSLLERATYVCGRGEIENYFRSAEKPAGYEQDLSANCQLRARMPYEAISELESYIAAGQQQPSRRDIQENVLRARYILGQIYSFLGNLDRALEQFRADQELALTLGFKDQAVALEKIIGITQFRAGQVENWLAHHNVQSSLFPVPPEARFTETAHAEEAIKNFLQYLEHEPHDLEEKWFLNLTYMCMGKYPESVPPKHLLPLSAFESKDDIGRFRDVAPELGVAVFVMAGSVIMEDFDNDGYLDLMVSTGDHCQALHYFHNNGDGTFEDRTAQAGLSKLLGGFSMFQADYNNDGWMDLYVVRGAWETPVRHSLLRNNGDGTFTDVTVEAGVNILPAVASQTAAWADYDNDGNVDLFVGAEYGPGHLFHNNGDGTFTDVSHRAGVDRTAFTKSAAWGDFDNDGYPELYVSNEGEENWLYYYNRDGTFTEIARQMHVETPIWSFPVWFWDYDNDGWLDLYVSSHYESVSHIMRGYLREPTGVERHALYHNQKGKAFENVTRQVGLDVISMAMGANFGDLDNDGWLDFYIGTGAPSYGAFVPNMLFRNVDGKRFVDITASSGTGSLQKGHGVAIGNLFHDGQPAMYVQLGGMVPGDRYYSALYKNPGTHNNWIDIRLVGVKTNRAAIGARIKVTVEDEAGHRRDIHRHVFSGGAFGASPLSQLVGVGKATRISALEIWWPTSQTRQVLQNLPLNQYIEVKEFGKEYTLQQTRPGRPPQGGTLR
ncbi:MAG TPA: CRTAC1 family protein [Terriglobia bacterium]|nr:CRTAC1 family protein [Terriglobia bacterium]